MLKPFLRKVSPYLRLSRFPLVCGAVSKIELYLIGIMGRLP